MRPALTLPAFAKINLDLRVLGMRADGYHDLRTIFQSLALCDQVSLTRRPGRLVVECNDPAVPTDQRNLVWKTVSLFWRTALAGSGEGPTPRGLLIRLDKRIPAAAGLGGASADAAVTLLGLTRLWNLSLDVPTLSRLAARLGADVPFFLAGGTALGLGRGDDIYPLLDLPRTSVVIVRPPFGVLTVDAYRWYDEDRSRPAREPAPRRVPPGWPAWAGQIRNDLEFAVTARHPMIARIKRALLEAGATVAAMSGSGSAVFGLFAQASVTQQTLMALARPGWHVTSTRTLTRREYAQKLQRALAAINPARIS